MVIRGVVFDIDDTLYDERDYVRSGFDHVAALVERSPGKRETLRRWLEHAFEAGVRGHTFDRMLETFPAVAERFSVETLVEAYRGHRPAIELAPDVESTLESLGTSGLRLGALSDGPLASQTAKAIALDLRRWLDPIVFTDALGPGQGKPAIAPFESIGRGWGLGSGSLVYVADNPEKDFAGPRSLGWSTIRLRHPGQLRYRLEPQTEALRPDLEIGAITGLLTILRTAESG
jgi:putative hydrolase of the HAD superfamily